MVIGVAAVITLVAMGNGAQATIEQQIKGAGTNMITVSAGNFTSGGVRQGSGASTSLTVDDAEAIRREVPGVQYLAAGVTTRAQVVAGEPELVHAHLRAPMSTCRRSVPGTPSSGTFFSEQDVRSAAKVAVLGATVNEQLFGKGVRFHRPGDPHRQPAVQGPRRDGGQGTGSRARTWTTRF